MSEAPLVHGFAINPEGGPDIIVEGNRRFVREDEFLAFKAWSATALAEAEARGRRQGLEEAAKNDHSKDFQLLIVRIIQRHRNGRDLTETLEGAADLLRRKGSLSPLRATTPAETQKPETGESDHE